MGGGGFLFFVLCYLLLVFGSAFFVRGCWFRAKGEGSEPFETYWDGWGLRPGGSYWSASVITGIGLGRRPEKAGGTDRLWSLAPGGVSEPSGAGESTSVEQRSQYRGREFTNFHAGGENQRETAPGSDLV